MLMLHCVVMLSLTISSKNILRLYVDCNLTVFDNKTFSDTKPLIIFTHECSHHFVSHKIFSSSEFKTKKKHNTEL